MLRTDTTLPALIQRRAAENPEAPFIIDAESRCAWTYAHAAQEGKRWTSAFDAAGVRPGDTVLTMLPPCTTSAAVWIALGALRAIDVTVNTGYRGGMLRYVIDDSQAELAVVHADHLEALTEALGSTPGRLRTIIVVGGIPATGLASTSLSAEEFLRAGEGRPLPAGEPPTERDTATVIYTSGTTGASKGVLVTWRQIELTATVAIPPELFEPADSYYSPFPMFHMTGRAALVGVALSGASAVIRPRFDTKRFWTDIRTHNVRSTLLLGAMANFLRNQPPTPDEADNPLRDVIMVPLIPRVEEFADRFGVRVRTMFNMTETACCIVSDGTDLADPTSCGRVRPGFQARLVDADDVEVGPGELGELVLRSDQPWSLMAGYWGKPEATLAAWRNLWFHTGDGFTRDDAGNFHFVDRLKDAIRRRGENISSAEVEAEVDQYPPVLESAVIGVPSEYGEDEVKVVVVARPGHHVEPAALIDFLAPRMARFMLPRYVDVVAELPKTPTQKVRKTELRSQGVTPTTWDRETAHSGRATASTS